MDARAPLYALLLLLATAALPAVESNDLVKFYFYNKDNAAQLKGNLIHKTLDKQSILDAGYNPEYPTEILIHGYINGVNSLAIQLPKNAHFRANESVNVIAVDWELMPLYSLWILNMGETASRTAELVDLMVKSGLLKLDRLHITGHSLGAHVAGMVGERVTSGRVGRITGLDPARPMINMNKVDGRLSKDDADLVDVIHTNAGGLGEASAVGHIDFYPNGGKEQPGCAMDLTGACSHGRSFQLMAESIENPTGFKAWKCEDEWDAVHQRCPVSETVAYMGEHVKFSEEGAYYLETNGGLLGPFSRSNNA